MDNPRTFSLPGEPSWQVWISRRESSKIWRFSWFSILFRASTEYHSRSFWHLGDQTAGPLDLLSILNWIPVASALFPISPPRASISLTRCPFAVPQIAGLQDILPIDFLSIVKRAVLHPILAAASDASIPAWPPPTTATSRSEEHTSELQ